MNDGDATENPRRRAPQRKMTDVDKAALIEILKRPDIRVEGKIHIPTVVTLSGMSYGTVYNFIRSDRYWHAQVGEADVAKLQAEEHNLIDGKPPVTPDILITDGQLREYQALVAQAQKFASCDWVALGMTEEAGKRMTHYMTLGMAPTSGVLNASTGQLVSNLELLDRIIKGDCERVLTGKIPAETTKNGEPREPEEVERDWRYMVFKGMELQLSMFSHLHKVQALRARVFRDMRNFELGAKEGEKGHFSGQPVAEQKRDTS